jgi:hypothetical protein
MFGTLLRFELLSVLKQPLRWVPPMVALIAGSVTLFFDSEGRLDRTLTGPMLFVTWGQALWMPLTYKAYDTYLLARPISRMQVPILRCCIFGMIGGLAFAVTVLFGMAVAPEHVEKPALVIEGFENVQKFANAGHTILFQDEAQRLSYLSWLTQPVRGQGQARVEGLASPELLGAAIGFCTYMLLMLASIRPTSSAGQASGPSWGGPVDLIFLSLSLLWFWIAWWETSLFVTLVYLHTLPVAGAVLAVVIAFGAQAAWRWRHTNI